MGKDRKALILEVAERHFAVDGFAGASLSAIARDCELGNAGLLHHFASKELLYRALLEAHGQNLMQRMDALLAHAAPPDQLAGFIALQLDWMRDCPTAAQLITRELLDNSERIAKAQPRPLERFLNAALTLLEDGQRTGQLRRDLPALALLTMVLGSLNYAHIVRPTFERAFADPALADETAWMQGMATHVLQLLAPASGAASDTAAR